MAYNFEVLPPEFLERMKIQLGDSFEAFLKSYNEPAPVSVRVNPFKSTGKFDKFEKVSWASNAFYLPERISFTLDPEFHTGSYYVQEASSMYIEAALQSAVDLNKPLKVLDLCAAPGGKSTHLVSVLHPESVLVSNEVISSRNKILQQNIVKWGTANVVVTQNDTADFKRIPNYFDVIVVDAPCSGEGLFRKDENACKEWSIGSVERCSLRQNDILVGIVKSLKENGILLYSTCTFESSENDDQVEKLISSGEFEKLPLPAFKGIIATKYGVQFYPHNIKGEGFYLSMLRKKTHSGGNINYGKPEFSSKHKSIAGEWLNNSDESVLYQKENNLYAIPEFIKQDFTLLMKNLFVRQAGILIGQLMKNDLVPSHQLAQSINLITSVTKVNLNEVEALEYLRCETVTIPGLTSGWKIVSYNEKSLGWIKALGNRINNYYPKELRILMR